MKHRKILTIFAVVAICVVVSMFSQGSVPAARASTAPPALNIIGSPVSYNNTFSTSGQYTLTVQSGYPNSNFNLCAIFPGGTQSCTPWGTTDANGSWTSALTTWPASTVLGKWTEWIVFPTWGNVNSNNIYFTLTAPAATAPNTGFNCPFTQSQSASYYQTPTENFEGATLALNPLYFATQTAAQSLATCIGGGATVGTVVANQFTTATEYTIQFPNGQSEVAGYLINLYIASGGGSSAGSGTQFYNYVKQLVAGTVGNTQVSTVPSTVGTSAPGATTPVTTTPVTTSPTSPSTSSSGGTCQSTAPAPYNKAAIQSVGSWVLPSGSSDAVWQPSSPSYAIKQLTCICGGGVCTLDMSPGGMTPLGIKNQCYPPQAPATGEAESHYTARQVIGNVLATFSASDQQLYMNNIANSSQAATILQLTTIPVSASTVATLNVYGLQDVQLPVFTTSCVTTSPSTPTGTGTSTGTSGGTLGGTPSAPTAPNSSATTILNMNLNSAAQSFTQVLASTAAGQTASGGISVGGTSSCASTANATIASSVQTLQGVAAILASSNASPAVLSSVQTLISDIANVIASLASCVNQ